jgi:2-polyprenyl-3-methyl-5-hydroxy-6-metoxy-1,4-benzoquinol methylase
VQKATCLPSPWFTWHANLIRVGSRVLDVACGQGRHAIAAARLGARVIAVDADEAALAAGRDAARAAGVTVEFLRADLRRDPIPSGPFDLVLVFNYLDRTRMPGFLHVVAPGGHILCETFVERQREFGWGPESPEHLLKPLELLSLVAPFEIVLARDVIETIDGRQMAIGSVLARRPSV